MPGLFRDPTLDDMFFDMIKAKIADGDTDFFDEQELNLLERLSDRATLQFVRGQEGVEADAPLEISELLKQYRVGTTPADAPAIQHLYDQLEKMKSSSAFKTSEQEYLQNLQARLLNYADANAVNPFNPEISDTEFANRHIAFNARNIPTGRIFEVRENPFLSLSLPANAASTMASIQNSFDFDIGVAAKEFGLQKQELLAVLTADEILNGQSLASVEPGRLLDYVLKRAQLLAKVKAFAGKDAPMEKAFSLYNNYNTRMVSQYGYMGALLNRLALRKMELQNELSQLGPLDLLSFAGRIRNMYESLPDMCSQYQLTTQEQGELVDFYINLLNSHGAESTWLVELKNVLAEKFGDEALSVYLSNFDYEQYAKEQAGQNEKEKGYPRAAFAPFNGNHEVQPKINFNMGKHANGKSRYFNSNMAIAEMLHELYHAYQYYVQKLPWGEGAENDSFEYEAYLKQFELEKILNIPCQGIREQFRKFDEQIEFSLEKRECNKRRFLMEHLKSLRKKIVQGEK